MPFHLFRGWIDDAEVQELDTRRKAVDQLDKARAARSLARQREEVAARRTNTTGPQDEANCGGPCCS